MKDYTVNTPQLPSKLDMELRDILFTAAGGISDMATNEIVRIKRAIDEHVLGEKITALDLGALTGAGSENIVNSLTQGQAAYLIAHNSTITKQRRALWGTDSNPTNPPIGYKGE